MKRIVTKEAFGKDCVTHAARDGNREHTLLIADGHSSHVNLRFLDYADRERIIVLILPPHTSHRLQPLDLGLFAPLAVKRSYAYT